MKLQKFGEADVPRSLTLYVVFSISVLIIYTIVEQVLVSLYNISHDTLTTCIFSFFGGEVVVCALIKIFKLHTGRDRETSDLVDDVAEVTNSREG